MSKTIYDGSVKTQSIDSVKSLLSYVGRASNPLPTDVSLEGGRVVLILSNKRDCYYVATQKTCSCPANTWHPGQPCKHQRKFFATPKTTQAELEAESDALLAAHNTGAKRLARPVDSIRPEGKWPGGLNGPVDECRGAA
jgi:hypothetical protein